VVANVKTAQVRQLRSASGGLRLRLLGPVAIVHDGKPVAIAAKKARALLCQARRGIINVMVDGVVRSSVARLTPSSARASINVMRSRRQHCRPLNGAQMAPDGEMPAQAVGVG
jgi:hypothetical protein